MIHQLILLILIVCSVLSCSLIKNHNQTQTQQIKQSKSLKINNEKSIVQAKPLKKIIKSPTSSHEVFCAKLDQKFKAYKWGNSRCNTIKWKHVRNSFHGSPLLWKVFGEENKNNNVTMILCGVHGDEITPIKFCFDIIHYLNDNSVLQKDQTVIVAPIVTPDSFLTSNPTRTNARKIDVNRNFPTKDWYTKAIKMWRNRYGSNPRRYPGVNPSSEAETIFQMNLIKRYSPQKIISVHAPLTLLDYDGPRIAGKTSVSLGEKLLKTISKKAYNYKIRNYPFFPGSLGNYAGHERKIPTYTLELPNSDPSRSKEFWRTFQIAIKEAIKTDFRSGD